MTNGLATFLVLLATVLGAVGALFLKQGAHGFSLRKLFDIRHSLRQHKLIAGVIIYLCGTVLYLAALRTVPLSLAYPLTSLTYLWIILLSRWFLAEEIDVWHWAAIVLIMAGAVLLSFAIV